MTSVSIKEYASFESPISLWGCRVLSFVVRSDLVPGVLS